MNRNERESYLERSFEAFKIRRQFFRPKPSAHGRRTALGTIFQPYSQEIIEAIHMNKDRVRSQLADLREAVMGTGENPSRPQLCTRYMLNGISFPLQNLALHKYGQGGLQEFIFWYDIGFGVTYIASRISFAESSVRGNADSQVTEGIDLIQNRLGISSTPSDLAQSYIRSMHEATGVERLLINDPSGLLLIDKTIKQFRNPRERTYYQGVVMKNLVEEYVIAGTELAQGVYTRLYPLSEST